MLNSGNSGKKSEGAVSKEQAKCLTEREIKFAMQM